MEEKWKDLLEFPSYAVSDYGRIINKDTERIKVPSLNQNGVAHVLLMQNLKQFRRSVALLVAKAFLPVPKVEHFDTPINLNGDRLDNRAANLAWRPRWFAIKYHQQFFQDDPEHRGFNQPVELIQTGERFETSWDAAVKYGLLDKEIFVATFNQTYVFPTGHRFRVID